MSVYNLKMAYVKHLLLTTIILTSVNSAIISRSDKNDSVKSTNFTNTISSSKYLLTQKLSDFVTPEQLTEYNKMLRENEDVPLIFLYKHLDLFKDSLSKEAQDFINFKNAELQRRIQTADATVNGLSEAAQKLYYEFRKMRSDYYSTYKQRQSALVEILKKGGKEAIEELRDNDALLPFDKYI
ncbi:unnamed protein product [Bursaphelenchus okinawaensis]|uniref:Uncharacterized protein n=1 Tax=Bursaphelenchus okinawaensis TaxID=465554 RepID=A0A811LJW3_9BILA|nr:unnamed protein product [Bursaphelenchus okinawaensis]CAG9127306.1 unnamed protein product [Bursaphelenchus okinawaensis]